jgi:serine/threonine protein kinase
VIVSANARLGSYRLIRVLGEGGMGVVWEAEHTGLQKRVALKTLRTEALTEPSVVERFLREGKTASKFRHPNVVDITDVGQADGVPYLVMEFLEGESLAARIQRGPALSLRETADIFIPVFAALQDAHDAGIVHRDIKPDNIFLARGVEGHIRPVVLDFGIAKVAIERAEDGITRTATFLGTPFYVSPEQASDDT